MLWFAPVEDIPPYLLVLTLMAVGLFFVAVAIELVRRRRRRHEVQHDAWRHMEQIAKDKGLSDGERAMLDALVARWRPDDPVGTVTVRHRFDECITQEMRRLQREVGGTEFEQDGKVLRDIRGLLGLDYIPHAQPIQSTRELAPAQPIWIGRPGQGQKSWIRLTVVEVDEARWYATAHDPLALRSPEYTPGEQVHCRMWREDDARYRFTCHLVRQETKPPRIVFDHTGKLDRRQARAHFRIPFEQQTMVGILNAPPDGDTTDIEARQAVTKVRIRITNLSAGGFAAVLDQALSAQVWLRLGLDIPGEDMLVVEARVIEVAPMAGRRYLLRAAFIAIDDETRDIIARYVMHRQQLGLEGLGHREED